MQAQDTATAYFFKAWSWVEANIKQIALGLVAVVVVVVAVAYHFWRQNQTEIDAGQALTRMLVSITPNTDAASWRTTISNWPGIIPAPKPGNVR